MSTPMDNFDYIKNFSGESGGLSLLAKEFTGLNESLTKHLDKTFSPEDVDSYDASCNTCKSFERKPMSSEQKRERNIFGMPGYCNKKNVNVTGWQRGQYCGFENGECYENRRTGMKPSESMLVIK